MNMAMNSRFIPRANNQVRAQYKMSDNIVDLETIERTEHKQESTKNAQPLMPCWPRPAVNDNDWHYAD